MREMKDSGVAWIGEIPQNWRTAEIKMYCQSVYAGGTPQSNKEEYWDGDIPWIPSGSCHDCKIYSAPKHITKLGFENSSTKLIPANSPVVAMTGATCANTGFLTFNSCANQSVTAYIAKETTYPLYLWYLLQAARDHLLTFQTGGAQGGINVDDCKNIVVPYVEYNEQKQIADYLDYKCSKIDFIIAKQKAIIERLKEYKISKITEAVTKGLNPKVEMKDSGIEWISVIPNHWGICKLKYLFETGEGDLKIGPFGSAMKGKTLESGQYKIYNQAHLIANDFSLCRHFVSAETFNDLINYEVKPNDILFSMMGTIGKCCIMPVGYPRGIMDSHLLKAKLNNKVLPDFFLFAYDKDLSRQVVSQLIYLSNGTIMNGLNSNILKNIVIALPPVNEQRQIVKWLKSFAINIDKQIHSAESSIVCLQEYKKSLIFEVVTGKKEV